MTPMRNGHFHLLERRRTVGAIEADSLTQRPIEDAIMLKRSFVAISLSALASLAAPTALADKPPIYTPLLSDVAAGGYDVVAYFENGAPVQGANAFEYMYKGTKWRFASAAHLAAFEADPEKYAPQFGGYCAWAVSQGYTAKGDPKYWRIVDGKLYLNYDGTVQQRWEKDIPGFISKADANWPAVLRK